MIAANAAAIRGAIPQEAATCETLPSVHSQVMEVCEANPTPIKAPTIVWVVETGKPRVVAVINQVPLPTSAQPMANMRAPGFPVNLSIPIMPFLIVSVTRAPMATAPMNSVAAASIPACHMVNVLAATDVAYALATSLAPLPKALKTKAMVVRARIQSYLAVRADTIVNESCPDWSRGNQKGEKRT